ncbi:MAG: hypothetical protein ACRECX_02025 [Methyloceanibacter sp.]|uniref:hypothetical protein n=1 Tax=Methyloceanibacter sp. TaxID=1965321 RepID=UPI003D6D4F17
MASPMREKRAWSTQENDAESKETAAFEATVAAAKDTAAKSGAFLSTAKEDLTDHRRWLQAQTVAVERDRARHERWLQRQRDHRVAIARKERTRRRRQLMRQRALRAVQQAVWAAGLFVRSLVLLIVAKIVGAIRFVGSLIARGVAAVYAGVRGLVLADARQAAAAARWTGAKVMALARWVGGVVSSGAEWSGTKAVASARAGGAALAVGSAVVAATAQSSARAGARGLAAGSSLMASRAGALGHSAGRSLGKGLSLAAIMGSGLADATAQTCRRGLAIASRQASAGAAAGKRGISAAYAWSKPRVQALAPALYVRIAKAGRQAERYARAAAARAKEAVPARGAPSAGSQGAAVEIYGPFPDGYRINGVSLNEPLSVAAEAPVAPPVESENALSSWAGPSRAWPSWAWPSWARSSWARTRDVDLSQMMIIAGAVLLVCGGLLLGGGLILRAGAGTQQAAEEEMEAGISWTFEEPDRPLPERAVFTLSGTPASFRINGLKISGINESDQPLTSVQAVLKPDVQRPALKLTLQVDKAGVAIDDGDDQAQSLEVVPEHTVPPHAPFRLVFSFPPEAMDGEDGITVEEFFESYGGLVLNLTYEIDGNRKSLIQYLPPQMLRSQLDEVAAGS